MKAFRIVALAVCLSVTLNACVSYQKPGGTAAEWEQVKAACQLEAARQVRPDYTTRVEPGYTSSGRQCDKKGKNCQDTSTYTPPQDVRVDDNYTLRDQVTKGCYARHGWTLQRTQ